MSKLRMNEETKEAVVADSELTTGRLVYHLANCVLLPSQK